MSRPPTRPAGIPRITLVGGGAGGLELATRLGDSLGRTGRAEIVLVDASLTHLWKPLYHEVAAGSLDSHDDELEFLAQARWHHFRFRVGQLQGLDRRGRQIELAPIRNAAGEVVLPVRRVRYDVLVIAIGSVANDFGIPGVKAHCTFLDTREQADAFQQRLLEEYLQVQTGAPQAKPAAPLDIAIVGAGATGVELAAALHEVADQLVIYGFDRLDPRADVRLSIIGSHERILPALPARVAASAERELRRLGVRIYNGQRVTAVTPEGLHTDQGLFIPAQLKMWAAGIKAPEVLRGIDGLETNALDQLCVHDSLQSTRDPDVFAFGDCAACPQPGTALTVPPTAQAATQQARFLARSLARHLRGAPLPRFVYRDRGSLVSLSGYETVGSLMGRLTGDIAVEGRLARFAYRGLYRRHQAILHGTGRTLMLMLAAALSQGTRPRLKLH